MFMLFEVEQYDDTETEAVAAVGGETARNLFGHSSPVLPLSMFDMRNICFLFAVL